DRGAVADDELAGVPRPFERLQPGARAHVDVVADRDPLLADEPDRQLEHAAPAEGGERAGREGGERLGARTDEQPVATDRGTSERGASPTHAFQCRTSSPAPSLPEGSVCPRGTAGSEEAVLQGVCGVESLSLCALADVGDLEPDRPQLARTALPTLSRALPNRARRPDSRR